MNNGKRREPLIRSLENTRDKSEMSKESSSPSDARTSQAIEEGPRISVSGRPVGSQPKPKKERNKIKLKPKNSTNSEARSSSPLPMKKVPFEERHHRITTYLENSVYNKVQTLHKQGKIDTISNLINTTVKEFVQRYYT